MMSDWRIVARSELGLPTAVILAGLADVGLALN